MTTTAGTTATTTLSATATATPRPRRDLRRAGRIFSAILMPVGFAAIALGKVFYPLADPDGMAAHQWGIQFSDAVGVVAMFTLVPGTWAAHRLLRRYRPVLSAWTALLLIPAFLAMNCLALSDPMFLTLLTKGWSPTDAYAFQDDTAAVVPVIWVFLFVFVYGHIIGTVLLGITAIRARLVPIWVGVLLVVSQPLHFAAGVFFQLGWLDSAAWWLTTLGMVFLARQVLRTPDEEWELPALPQSSVQR